MRAVLQRVTRASVSVRGKAHGHVGQGLVILLAVHQQDTPGEAAWLARKITEVRLFDDAQGRMNLSVSQIGGDCLVVSQFTLFGDLRKGTRPSFHLAASPESARELYGIFLNELSARLGRPVVSGEFGAPMAVDLCNDGPVTLILDSPTTRLKPDSPDA